MLWIQSLTSLKLLANGEYLHYVHLHDKNAVYNKLHVHAHAHAHALILF
jgi:hypothetical protein